MAENRNRTFKIKVAVHFWKRDDGGLCAECDAVPGFYLSGQDKRAVMGDVIPALETLLRVNWNVPVQVSPLGYGIFQLTETLEAEMVPDLPEYTQEYVVEKIAA